MIYKTLTMAVVAAALLVCGTASAQDCGSCGAVAQNEFAAPSHSCGRGITQQEAASLWAGYCTEDCDYKGDTGGCRGCGSRTCGGGCRSNRHCGKLFGAFGRKSGCDDCSAPCSEVVTEPCGDACGGCGGGKKRRGLFGGCGNKAAGCGCDMGCFGYPTACGCGSDAGGCGAAAGGCGSNGCGRGCKMGGKLRGMFSGCGSKKCGGLFSCGKNKCGCNGAYFDETVSNGMQSCVSGCANQGCANQAGQAGAPVPMPAAQAPVDPAPAADAGSAVQALENAAGN